MKKLPKLLQLRSCNNNLRKQAWANYLRFLESLLRSTNHPKFSEALVLLEKEDYTGLVVLADCLSTAEYTSAAEHRLCNQLSAVIKKYPFPTGCIAFNPREKALETFMKAERKCQRVNKRFRLFDSLRSPHESALKKAQSWIHYTLGDLNLQEVWDLCDFGPGASIGIHGNATNQARKLLSRTWSVTPSAFYYAMGACKRDHYFWELLLKEPQRSQFSWDLDLFNEKFRSRTRLVDYNKISFVPKTVKTERTIAVEPLLNGYIQKGVDEVMRKRLTRVGIDLRDQTLNQGLALIGSFMDKDDPYVTIDLSSASDSITTELCRRLLPPDWFEFLDSIRSKSYSLDGVVRPYHKFVTMGNGFCFPLETLIFASLCETAYSENRTKPDYSVYGDDIIVRYSFANRVLELLRVCGFKANSDKTFLTGPFRESCGADWFEGEDVRPINLDYAFDSVENIIKFCNIAGSKDSWKAILYEPLKFLKSLIPSELMFVRPYKGNPDTALEVPLDEFLSSPFSRWNRNLQCWSWVEIRKSAWQDLLVRRLAGYDVVLMRGALTGSQSSTPFAERRKTRTKLSRVSHSGCASLFVPGEKFLRAGGLLQL